MQHVFAPGTGDGTESMPAYRAMLLRSLAAVIDAARPHVVAMQELGPHDAVGPLQEKLSWKMRHAALGEPDGRGIRVGFLSTRVPHEPVGVRVFPAGLLAIQVGDDPPGPPEPPLMNQLGRGASAVTVRAAGRDVTILNCHRKSKLLSYPERSVLTAGREHLADPIAAQHPELMSR